MLTVNERAVPDGLRTASRIAEPAALTMIVASIYIDSAMPLKRSAKRKLTRKTQPRKNSGSGKGLELLSSRTVFRGRVFNVTSDRVQEPNGITAARDVVRHGGSVVVLAVADSDEGPRVLLERQYRYAADDYVWEIPAGRKDPGESSLSGAKRELLEETGYKAKHWRRVLFFYPSPGFLDETMTVFMARGLTQGQAYPEKDESIECKVVPLAQAVEMVFAGKICDGKTIASLLWLSESLRRGPVAQQAAGNGLCRPR
jgi:ADP-ribose diphosphatase